MSKRHYTLFDKLLIAFDNHIGTLTGNTQVQSAPYPAQTLPPEDALPPDEQRRRAALMRVNHAGEVCAQALYHGQALTARTPEIKALLKQSAVEEGEHLAFCATRIKELQDHVSYLNAFWYWHSFCLGALVGLCGDKISLGFLAETERQVVAHLDSHLKTLTQDPRSTAILQQMRQDEAEHGEKALAAGGKILPRSIALLMQLASRVMTTTAYYM